jgi:hypothetical protein
MPVDTPRPEYATALGWWGRCRDVLEGSDAVKAAGEKYLPRLGGQTDPEYGNYKLRALFYNGSARTLQALAGTIFRKPPAVQVLEKLAPHLDDITLDDTSLEMFALGQLEEVIGVGRVGLLVDMPGDTVADADRRPYWVSYRAEQILNWHEDRLNGHNVLSLVILKETVEQPTALYGVDTLEQYRVLTLTAPTVGAPAVYTVRLYRRNAANEIVLYQEIVPQRRGQPLPFIPFVITNATSLRARVEKPPLLDLIDVNLSHYRSSADHEHGLHFTALPTPWVVGANAEGGELRIGAGVAWELSGPDARAGMLEFSGAGMEAIEKNLTMKEERMAVLGARMIEGGTGGQPETAEAVRARHAATHATLKTIATTNSAALTKALRIHAWWMNASETVADPQTSVTLNREFYDAKLSAEDVKALVLAVQAGQMSFETFYWNLQEGARARPDVTAEQEQADIDAMVPPEPVVEPPVGDPTA